MKKKTINSILMASHLRLQEMAQKLYMAKQELEQKNEELKKLDQLKSAFVANVSHEIRIPLTILRDGIFVVRNIVVKSKEKQEGLEELLTSSLNAINRLTRIVNDLLNFSKIEAGREELKRTLVDLSKIVNETSTQWKLEAEKKHQDLRVSLPKVPICLEVDPDKIIQILNNLISNAIKFTPEKGRIEVALKDNNDQIEVSVSDTGMGIAKEDLPKVGDKFQQFHRVAGPGAKGTGLGLAISKALIQMHQGNLTVESEINKGSTFTFSLPKGGKNRRPRPERRRLLNP